MGVEGIGKAVGYSLYVLGGSVVIGAGRAIDAGAHIIKHLYYQAAMTQAVAAERLKDRQDFDERQNIRRLEHQQNKQSSTQASKQLEKSKEGLKKASGVGDNLKAFGKVLVDGAKKVGTEVKNGAQNLVSNIEEVIDETIQEFNQEVYNATQGIIELKEKSLRDEWLVQFVLGLIEMIPLIGGVAGLIYSFNHQASSLATDPGFLEFGTLYTLHQVEQEVDSATQNFIPSYNPLFH